MTTAWVVHESTVGTTRAVADVIAEALASRLDVERHEVSTAQPVPRGLGLLVLGGPAHATGIREWLDPLGPSVPPMAFATFETRVRRPRAPGSAAKQAAKALRRHGGTEIAAPVSFWIHGIGGPLLDGELDRARVWALDLADVITGPDTGEDSA